MREFQVIVLEHLSKMLAPFIILGLFFTFDFILGVTKGIFIEGISSKKLKLSLPKMLGYIIAPLLVMFIDILAAYYSGFELFINYSPICLAVCIWLIVTEAISIIENLEILGVPMPKFVIKNLEKIKKGVDDDEI